MLYCCFDFSTVVTPQSTAISASNCHSEDAGLLLWQWPSHSGPSLVGVLVPLALLLLKAALTKSLLFYLKVKLESQRLG